MKKMMIHGVMVTILFNTTRCSQHNQSQLINYFEEKNKTENISGAFLFAENGKTTFNQAFGYANFEEKISLKLSSQFNIVSISKVFTSTAIMQLHEQNKIKIDDKLVVYFPDFPFPDITLKQVLSHTSGLPDLEVFGYLVEKNQDTIVSNACVLPALKVWKNGLYFKPGDDRRYSNIGYNLLAMLVEKVAKMPFEDYLREYIFKPSQMNQTYLDLKAKPSSVSNKNLVTVNTLQHRYDTNFTDIKHDERFTYPIYNCSGLTGQGNIVSTVDDMLAFDKALFSYKLISKSTLDLALTPIKLNNGLDWTEDHMDTMEDKGTGSYGLGWYIFNQPDFGKSVGHGGYLIGLASFYYHNLEKNQTIIAFQNTSSNKFGNYVTSMMKIANGKPAFTHPYTIKKSFADVFGQELVKNGVNAVKVKFKKLSADTAHFYLMEHEFNELGYEFLWDSDHIKNHKYYSVTSFQMNVTLFPQSANALDSYAETLWKSGLYSESIENYKKAIALNPANEESKKNLKLVEKEFKNANDERMKIVTKSFDGNEVEAKNSLTIVAKDKEENAYKVVVENDNVKFFYLNDEKIPSDLQRVYVEMIDLILKNGKKFTGNKMPESVSSDIISTEKHSNHEDQFPEGQDPSKINGSSNDQKKQNKAFVDELINELVRANAIAKSEEVKTVVLTNDLLLVNGKSKNAETLMRLKLKYSINPNHGVYFGDLEVSGSGIFISPSEIQ